MGRLPIATRESLPEAQRPIFDEMVQGLGSVPRSFDTDLPPDRTEPLLPA